MSNKYSRPEVEVKTSKTYTYKKNGVSLSFSLFVDEPEQPKAFLELLQLATEDVGRTIKEIEGK